MPPTHAQTLKALLKYNVLERHAHCAKRCFLKKDPYFVKKKYTLTTLGTGTTMKQMLGTFIPIALILSSCSEPSCTIPAASSSTASQVRVLNLQITSATPTPGLKLLSAATLASQFPKFPQDSLHSQCSYWQLTQFFSNNLTSKSLSFNPSQGLVVVSALPKAELKCQAGQSVGSYVFLVESCGGEITTSTAISEQSVIDSSKSCTPMPSLLDSLLIHS